MATGDRVEYRGWQADEADYRVVGIDGEDGSMIHISIEAQSDSPVDLDPSEIFGISFKVQHQDVETDWVCLDEDGAKALFRALSRAYADRERDGRAPTP